MVEVEKVRICELYAFMGRNDRADIAAGGTPELFYRIWVREEDVEEMTEWFRQTLDRYDRRYQSLRVRGSVDVPPDQAPEKAEVKESAERLIRENDQTPDF